MSDALINFSDSNRTQIASIITSSNASQSQSANNLARSTQIALTAAPLVTQNTVGTSYHVPRGPAVVANLAAPRSNVTTVRTPMVVTAQTNQVNVLTMSIFFYEIRFFSHIHL